jgi:beta-xylosidase
MQKRGSEDSKSLQSMKTVAVLITLTLLGLPALAAGQQTGEWGDQGDGTYRNPIIAADYSDPDVVRVGDDFYMVASTFESSPGVTVLHSKDLVNWRTIGAAFSDLSKLGSNFNWDRMGRYGEGIYAPSIRYHAGQFWIFVNCHSDEGFWQAHATDPAGPWIPTQIKDKHGNPLRVHGWTDPCPFWDDDGNAYLASSRPSATWYGYLFQMTPDGTQLLDADASKMNGSDADYVWPNAGTPYSPFHSTEGNKLFKRSGYYYLQHIEFLDTGHGHGTYLLRSKNIYGTKDDGTPGKPGDVGKYDLLKFGQEMPGQGGFVDTSDGRWFWIGQFNRIDSDGRMPNLLPVTWIDDWPVPGVDVQNKQGKMVWQMKKPLDGSPIELPQGSDSFDSPTLSLRWCWNHQPRADHWSLTERPRHLRLHAFKPLRPGQFYSAGNTIGQRHFRSDETTAIVELDLSGLADHQEGGLANYTGNRFFATIGVSQIGGNRKLKYTESGKVTDGPDLPAGSQTIWFRSTVKFDDINAYAYSLDGKTFSQFGGAYKLRNSGYRGDFVGIYSFNDSGDAGYIDVDSFKYTTMNRPIAAQAAR